jgi:predicted metal-dependent HD superfamily phosphohydrolase
MIRDLAPNDDRTERASLGSWQQVCTALGLRKSDSVYRKVMRAWSGRGRHYHTIEHLTACLVELDRARPSGERPEEIEVALWFHDAIYRTYRRDNESRSAAWAGDCLRDHGAREEVVTRVHDLILATTHQTTARQGDEALLVDIDLSILGQPEDVYDAFERNVRREYWWVPRSRYRSARVRILRSFLSRATIYQRADFQQRYELTARRNLARAIAKLGSG